jgi:purine-binding chemotaxis protein CheW
MDQQSYFVFTASNQRFALSADRVRGVFSLPELQAIAEAPSDIVGLLNFQGKIIPVQHFRSRLGDQSSQCQLSNQIIILEWRNSLIASIVDSVEEVTMIDINSIETEIDYQRIQGINPLFLNGVTQINQETLFLLNEFALIRQATGVEALVASQEIAPEGILKTFYDRCFPTATPEERAILRQRAENLRQGEIDQNATGENAIPLAVISLQDNYFGFPMDWVREFTKISNLAPIPCCPAHILGNMNLRGEIITLVDIRPVLKVAPVPVSLGHHLMIIEIDDLITGIPIDQVIDVIYLSAETLAESAANNTLTQWEYLQGTLPYQEKLLSLIDLPLLMNQDSLIVNETV